LDIPLGADDHAPAALLGDRRGLTAFAFMGYSGLKNND
jgi:hypothetical protein